MNATLPLCLAQAVAPFAPPQSVVHQIVKAIALTDEQRQRVDLEMLADKSIDGYGQRQYRSALALQIQAHPEQWRPA